MKTTKKLKKMMAAYSVPFCSEDFMMNMRYPVMPNMDNGIKSNIPPELSLKERQDFMQQKMQQGEMSKYQSIRQDEIIKNMLSVLIQQSHSMHKMKNQIHDLESLNESLEDSVYDLCDKLKEEKQKYHKSEKRSQKMAQEILKIEKFLVKQSCYLGVSDKDSSFDDLPSDWKAYCNQKKYKAMHDSALLPDYGRK